jgi:hypothetical protein
MPKNTLRATGGLNKDVDKYLLPKGDYIDANNIVLDTSASGGAGSLKTMEAIKTVKSFASGLTNPVVKAAVVDNLGVLYILVKGDTYAKIFEYTEGDTTFTEKVKYTHDVTTDFTPDLKKVGDVLVWNYHDNGTPLSWYTERDVVTISDIADLTLIKKPPTFNFVFEVENVGVAPTDLSLNTTSFSESLASGGTIATVTATDTAGETSLSFTLESILDANGTDASSRFTLVDSSTSDTTAVLQSADTFSYNNTADRSFTAVFKVVDSSNLSYSEEFTLTLTGATPTISASAYTLSIDDDEAVGFDTGIDITATSGTSDPANTEGLVFTSSNSQFEVDSNGNLVTATALTAGSYSLTITVTNAAGNTATTNTIAVTVNSVAPQNSAPVANDVTSFAEPTGTEVNHRVNFIYSVTDADGDDLTYSATLPSEYGGSISIENSVDRLLYTPPQDASVTSISASNPITYTANDGTVDSNTANISGILTTRPIVVRDTVAPGTWTWTINKMYLDTSDTSNPTGLSLATYTGDISNKNVYGKRFPVNTAASGSTYLYIVFTLSKFSSQSDEEISITLGSVGSKITNASIVSSGSTTFSSFTISAQFKIKCQLSTVVQPAWSAVALDSFINVNPQSSS